MKYEDKNSPSYLSMVACKKGNEHRDKGEYDKAVQCYIDSYNIGKGKISTASYCSSLNQLILLYRKLKDREKELKVLDLCIDEFMEQNKENAEEFIAKYPELEEEALIALETNTTILDNTTDNPFKKKNLLQYNLKSYISRRDKVKKMIEKTQQKKHLNR